GQAARGRARAPRGGRAPRQVRVHPYAGLHRLRRLYRNRPGHPGALPRPQGRLQPLHVSQRRAADRGRPRALGLSEKARQSDAPRRDRSNGRHARLWAGPGRICELVEYYLEDITLKGAWTGPAALSLTPHALAPVAELLVLEVVSAVHLICDIT